MRSKRIFIFLFLAFFFPAHSFGQVATSTYDKDGLKFSYPSDWIIVDRSSAETQHLLISKPSSLVLISIVSPRESLIAQKQFWMMRSLVDEKFFSAIEKGLAGEKGGGEFEAQCLDFNGRTVPGKVFRGVYQNEPSTGEIYPFALGDRLVGLIYLHAAKDDSVGQPVWREIIRSLTVAGSNKDTVGVNFNTELLDGGQKLRDRAIKLADPGYPLYSQAIAGVVNVRIVIDEEGNVVSAEADRGEKNFRSYAIAAALKSKFAPITVCGKPIRMRGTITYNFGGYSSPCNVGVPKRRC
jgi:TonB family protein